jgi:hypothetical protein
VGPHGPGGTTLDEIDEHVLATRDEILTHLTALAAQPAVTEDRPRSSGVAA